jgi:hypothetical protein
MSLPGGTNGILNPRDGLTRFRLARYAPADDLAPFVDRHWIVHWDRRGLPAFEQEILPAPCVHLSFRPGQSAVHGIGTRRFVARLESRSRVVGVKFRPGTGTGTGLGAGSGAHGPDARVPTETPESRSSLSVAALPFSTVNEILRSACRSIVNTPFPWCNMGAGSGERR